MSELPSLAELWQAFSNAPLEFLSKRLGPSAAEWIVAIALGLGLPPVLLFLRRRLASLPRRKTPANPTMFMVVSELAHRVKTWFLVAFSIWLALKPAPVPPKAEVFLDKAFVVCAFVQFAILAIWILDWGVERILSNSEGADATGADSASQKAKISHSLFRFLVRIIVITALVLSMLDNLGIEIKTLVAGLGIGGIAVALAVQNVLGDLLASLSIALDQPFEVGDVITLGPDHVGTVERIGVKTTRLRSNTGEQIIVANSDLLQARIRNFKRMQERRVVFRFGITYETPLEKVEKVTEIVKQQLETHGGNRIERIHFASLGASSLDFEAAFFVLSAEYKDYMDLQEKLNFGLMRKFAEEGIEFAYPTQTVRLQKLNG